MAYAFSETMKALGLQDQDQMGQQQGDSVSVTQENVGQSSGAGQSSAGQPQTQAQQPGASAGARGRVMAKNAQKAKAPTDMGRIASGIGQARQNIQQEANAYVQAADDPYEVSQEDVKKNVAGYAQGQQGDQSWLTKLQSAPGLVSDIDLKTDTNIKDVDLLGSDAGIREMFRRGQDPEGTIGEAALDTALLRRNEGFNQARDQALRDYQALQQEKQKVQQESRGKAQEARQSGAERYKKMVGEELQSYKQGLEEQARQKEAAFDQQLAALEASRRSQMQQQAEDAIRQMRESGQYREEGQFFNPEQYLSAGGDLSQFYTPGMTAEQTSYLDFYDPEQAGQFERIMGLLGGGETRTAGRLAGQSAEQALGGGFNVEAFKNQALASATKQAEEARAADLAAATAATQQTQPADQQTAAEAQNVIEAASQAAKAGAGGNIADTLTAAGEPVRDFFRAGQKGWKSLKRLGR